MKSDRDRYVILGSGIAGMSAAEAIREKDREAEILMISAEKELCFNRPMLIREFALDGSGARLFEKQQGWPEQFGVDVRLGAAADSIDAAAKAVIMRDGTSERYDRLIYALGAEVTIPPIPGADGANVFTVRTREDMRSIRQAMEHAEHAVVIGGGMLGLEDAWALYEEKIPVSIIERQQRVAFGQIDQSAGNLMKKRIERMGVPVYVNAEVQEIGPDHVTFIQRPAPGADTGQAEEKTVTVPADLVILSTGVTPNSALGKAAGLETAGRNGAWIAVDERMRTSDPCIFAAGDAAALHGRNDAIWDEARQMGRVAGANAASAQQAAKAGRALSADDEGDLSAQQSSGEAGKWETYTPVTAEHVFTGFDTEVFTMADSSGAGTDGVYIRHADVEIFDYQRERYIRVSLQDGIIAGILLINASELAPELMEAFRRGAGEEEAREIILRWKESHEVDFKPAAPFRKR